MIEYFEVVTYSFGANLFSSDYSLFDTERLIFDTAEQVKVHLFNKYPKAKREPITDDDSLIIGGMFRFRNADWSHAPVEEWNQIDRVFVSRIQSNPVVNGIW